MKKLKTEDRTKNFRFAIRNSQHGFSLVELMIALLITALVLGGIYTAFVVQQRSFIAQDQVTETQGSSKIAFDMIVNDIRNAGYGYPAAEAPQVNGYTSAITLGDALGPNGSDIITLVGGFRDIATIGLPAGQTNVEVGQTDAADNPYLDVCYTGTTKFNDTDKKYISIDGVTYAEITSIESGSSANCADTERLILDRPVDKAFPVDRPVYLVEDVTYRLTTADGMTNCNNAKAGDICLQRVITASGTVTIASDIEDLQFEEIDQNADGNTDRVRVSLLARTAREDPTLEPSTKPYYATGIDLEGNITPDTDRSRRRIWSMEVALKN
ncbi:MAG: prepilin-type N-terminal cleavage/methylation domain-containing protein [Nitrospirota bacterium]|nr:prepilin-type N-terminal cleavage/methylation domain-containing protein [Nitrospirota bacterium]